MRFEWDPAKAEKNLRKHGVSFEEASSAFNDPWAITFEDPEHSVGEERFITFGLSRVGRYVVVSHTERGGRIRIISGRRMTKVERKIYEGE